MRLPIWFKWNSVLNDGFAVGLPPMWDIDNGKSRIGVFGLMDQGSNNGQD